MESSQFFGEYLKCVSGEAGSLRTAYFRGILEKKLLPYFKAILKKRSKRENNIQFQLTEALNFTGSSLGFIRREVLDECIKVYTEGEKTINEILGEAGGVLYKLSEQDNIPVSVENSDSHYLIARSIQHHSV